MWKQKNKIYKILSYSAVALVTYFIVAYTPLRSTIPGYPDEYSKHLALSNAIKIDSLENIIVRWELYADNLSRVLAGEETIELNSLVKGNVPRYLSAKTPEELATGDSLLRETVRREERFALGTAPERKLPLEGIHFFRPLKGVVTAAYEAGKHPYLDISAPSGSAVCAILDGTVVLSCPDGDDGWMVAVQHPGDIVSVCRHCSRSLKAPGEKVRAGASIALSGAPGSDTAKPLGFEMWYKGEAVDAAKYINF
ncbi:MAG: M23 family metallopeptidase [Bacteroidales bacterium]|nr:M23 family metallopeptidase [Bacteroidales bacterium]